MSEGRTADELKQLLLMAKEAQEHQPTFFKALFQENLFTLRQGKTLVLVESPQGPAIPAWMSPEDLQEGIAVLGLQEHDQVGMNARKLFELASENNLFLHPGTEYKVMLSPGQTKAILQRLPPAEEPTPEAEATPNVQPQTAMYSQLPLALSIVTPLLEGRSDIAWSLVEREVEEGNAESLLKAMSLLIYTWISNDARTTRRPPDITLQRAAAVWDRYAVVAEEKTPVSIQELSRLTQQLCNCTHPAFAHGKFAWLGREFGTQTTAPCDTTGCACTAFRAAS